jgi:hypothetical protein
MHSQRSAQINLDRIGYLMREAVLEPVSTLSLEKPKHRVLYLESLPRFPPGTSEQRTQIHVWRPPIDWSSIESLRIQSLKIYDAQVDLFFTTATVDVEILGPLSRRQ